MTDIPLDPGTPPSVHAGQVLDSAKMIADYMVHLGFATMTEKKVFQWAATGKIPVKKVGNHLISTKSSILRQFGLE